LSQRSQVVTAASFAVGVCLLLAVLAFSAVLGWPSRVRASPCAADSSPESRPAPAQDGLSVRFDKSRMRVEWNPATSTIRNAMNGSLYIRDGAVKRTVPLDSSSLAAGGLWYKPSSIDLLFRLTVQSGGAETSQSARVLLSEPVAPAASDQDLNPPEQPISPPASPSPVPPPVPRQDLPKDSLKSFRGPVAIHRVQPPPSTELRRQLTETVVVRVRIRIDEAGNVVQAVADPQRSQVATALMQSAIAAAKQWTFQPAIRNGIPTACGYSIAFRFVPIK